MNDLISRAKLFNKLAVIKAPPEANEYKGEVYKIIQGMETSEDKWIPIGAKEPDTADHVLVTVRWAEDDYEVFEIDYFELKFTVGYCNREYTERERRLLDNIIAWMPMPEPCRIEV